MCPNFYVVYTDEKSDLEGVESYLSLMHKRLLGNWYVTLVIELRNTQIFFFFFFLPLFFSFLW